MRKLLIASVAVVAMTGTSFAEATMTAKDSYGQHTNGNTVSDLTNRVTGNGDWASGNGTGTGEWGAGDQTTGPGGRSATIQGVHALDGIGRSNNDGNKSGARSENGHH